MSSIHATTLNKLDLSKVSVGKPKSYTNGLGKSAPLSYEGGRFYLALTKANFPFGVSAKKEEFQRGPMKQWTLVMNLEEESQRILKQLDEKILDICCRDPAILLALKINDGSTNVRAVLESKYYGILKYQNDSPYGPSVKVSISNKEDKFNCSFFKSTGEGKPELIELDNNPDSPNYIGQVIKRSEGSVLVSPSIWISSVGFGVSLSVCQLKFKPTQSGQQKGVCLLDQFG